MAAWVEATTREMGQSLINTDKPSVSASALPGDTGKPALGPKPHLMPKPFALQRNATVRSIRAPKTNFSRELHRAASSEALLDIKKTDNPNPSESIKSGSNCTVNGSNQIAAPKTVPPGPKPDLSAKPKPEPTKSPGSNNQTSPNSKSAVTAEDVKDVQPRSRAKSLGAQDQKIFSQKVQGEAAKAEADVKVSSRCWPPRNRLSVELTSKFESQSQPEKDEKRDAETSKTEREWPPHSPSESKPSKLPVDSGENAEEDVSGGSIKRRISLLFDRSTAAQRRDTFNKRDNPGAEISVDIKQRIQNLSLDTPRTRLPSTGAPKSPPSEKTLSTLDETSNERPSEKAATTEKVSADKPQSMREDKNSATSAKSVEEEEYVPVPVYRRVGMSLDAETKRREEEEKQRKDEQLEKERQQWERERLLEEERKARELERQKEEEQKRAEEERKKEEEKQRQTEERRKQEEEQKRRINEERKEEERRRQAEKERERQIDEEKRRIEEEKERLREEERLKKEKEMEEERRRIQELERQREKERLRQEQEKQERLKKEREIEERKRMEEERLKEEERLRQERERQERLKKEREMEERKRMEEERLKEEERLRQEQENERLKKEKEMEEERRRIEELERQKEKERLRQEREKEERLKKQREMEERKRIEEERLKEEERLRQEREMERIRKEKEMEEERKRIQEIERQKEEERLRKERELERIRKEKEIEEERKRIQEIERQKEEERLRKERELEKMRKEKEMEEERQRIQKMERLKEAERLRKEQELERMRKEKEMEEERQRIQRQKEEERLRQEREIERLRKEREIEERKRMEEERKREEERLAQERERERIKKEKEMEEERKRIQELKRQKEEERQRQEREIERLRKEREIEERKRMDEERQREEERLGQQRERERLEEERRRTQMIERLKEEEKRRQEREHDTEMETSETAEGLQEEVPTSYDLISFDAEEPPASQTLTSTVSPRLAQLTYDDFSVKPRRWGTRARRSSTPSPSRETPPAPHHSLQPEPQSSPPGPREPSGDQVSVHDLIGFEPEASSPQNPTDGRTHTYLYESQSVDQLEPEAHEGQSKDGEPEEDGDAEQDAENLIGEADDQPENYDAVDNPTTQIRINQALQRLTQARQPNKSTDSDAADQEEPDTLPVLQSAAPLLDSSVFRSKVDLAKKRSIKRTRPSRAVRQRASLPALSEGTQPDWRFCDSTDAKDQCSNGAGSESEEEEPARDVTSSPAPSQPKRVPVFPGMDPSALAAQLKRRSGVIETESPAEAQTPASVPSRPPRTPTMALGPRVLPPVDAKDSGSGSSPSWLLELKSKKRMSQPESEA